MSFILNHVLYAVLGHFSSKKFWQKFWVFHAQNRLVVDNNFKYGSVQKKRFLVSNEFENRQVL